MSSTRYFGNRKHYRTFIGHLSDILGELAISWGLVGDFGDYMAKTDTRDPSPFTSKSILEIVAMIGSGLHYLLGHNWVIIGSKLGIVRLISDVGKTPVNFGQLRSILTEEEDER